jgi:hypothetical protein
MAGILLYVGRWFTFWRDEWLLIFHRPDLSPVGLLHPFGDTFVAIPVLVYDILLALFGLQTYVPFLLVSWAAHFAAVALLYRIVSHRSGALLGTAAAISLLFLGSGWEVLFHPFQMQFLFAVVGGLLAIDRLDRGRPTVAAVALVIAVASSGLGVIFTGLVLVWGALRRDRPALLATIPAIVVYATWFLTWGRESEPVPGAGLGPAETVYAVLYGMGAALSGLIGLPPERFAVVGIILGAGVATVLAALVWRGYRPDPLAVAAIAALAAEHILQSVLRGPLGVEHGARSGYIYPGVTFLWLAIAGLVGTRFEDMRARRPVAVPLAVAILLVPMVVANMRQFASGAVSTRALRATELAELRLIESLQGTTGLVLDVQPDDVYAIEVTAGGYLGAIDRFGRPTLDWDWESEVDPAAVDAARRRLLP